MKISVQLFLATVLVILSPILAYSLPVIQKITGTDFFTDKEIHMTTQDKKGLVVVFLSAKCPCSNSHMNELKNLFKSYPNFSFVAIHSNADENKDISMPYFKKTSLPFSIIEDQNSTLANLFQAFKTPHAYILLPNGELAFQGGVTNSHDFEKSDRKYLREALTDLDSGKPVRTPEARTLGCSIARKTQ
jgi:Thioredoxin-like